MEFGSPRVASAVKIGLPSDPGAADCTSVPANDQEGLPPVNRGRCDRPQRMSLAEYTAPAHAFAVDRFRGHARIDARFDKLLDSARLDPFG